MTHYVDIFQISAEKNSLQSIQDIEMELVKMHGEMEEEPEKENTMDIDNQNFHAFSTDGGDIIDSGAIEHSSDSDYEPPSSVTVSAEDVAQPAAATEKHCIGECLKS